MKIIDWDTLEEQGFIYNGKLNKWRKNRCYYVRKECCEYCGNPFLARCGGKGEYCNTSCQRSGKKASDESKKKMSKSQTGEKNGMYGKTHTDEVKKKLAEQAKLLPGIIREKYGVDNISQLDYIKEKKGQFIINKKSVSKYVKNEGYELININGNNKNAILTLKCPSNHIFDIKYHSFKKGHRCVECYYDRLRSIGIQDLSGFNLYKQHVSNYTRISYRNYYRNINPSELERGRGSYHLDHKYSIAQGFRDNIPSYIIGSYVNLQMLLESENCSKMDKCSITKEELFNEYFRKIK